NYFYDGDGRRVKKIVGNDTTVFVYNVAGQLIAEYTSGTPAAGDTSYLTTDHLGSTRLVTDSGGNVKARYDYLPFGEEIGANIGNRSTVVGYGAPDSTKQKFTQKERDAESALDYFLARYYSSAQGRFTSPDSYMGSIRDPQALNLYVYSRNSPLRFIDPSGHLLIDAISEVGADIAVGVLRGYAASVAGPFAPPGWEPSATDSPFSLAGQVIGSLIAINEGAEAIGGGVAYIACTDGLGALLGGEVVIAAGATVVAGGASNLLKIYNLTSDGSSSGGGNEEPPKPR